MHVAKSIKQLIMVFGNFALPNAAVIQIMSNFKFHLLSLTKRIIAALVVDCLGKDFSREDVWNQILEDLHFSKG